MYVVCRYMCVRRTDADASMARFWCGRLGWPKKKKKKRRYDGASSERGTQLASHVPIVDFHICFLSRPSSTQNQSLHPSKTASKHRVSGASALERKKAPCEGIRSRRCWSSRRIAIVHTTTVHMRIHTEDTMHWKWQGWASTGPGGNITVLYRFAGTRDVVPLVRAFRSCMRIQ